MIESRKQALVCLEGCRASLREGRRARVDSGFTDQHHLNMRLNIGVRNLPVCEDLCNVPCFKEELVARLRATLPEDGRLEDARVLFAALADRTRLKVLHALSSGEELCVCDVAHVLQMSVSATSHHLRKLRDLKILKYRNDGKMACYSLRDRFAGELVQQALRQAVT